MAMAIKQLAVNSITNWVRFQENLKDYNFKNITEIMFYNNAFFIVSLNLLLISSSET